jgi:hypothetical protein
VAATRREVHRAQFRPTRLSFDELTLSLETPHSQTRLTLARFEKFLETETLFLLYETAAVFHIIPKRAFTEPEQLQHFLALLTTQIPSGVVIPHPPGGFPVMLVSRRDAADPK